jgi:putative radical SAM enzyme (TIGR03279 family)
MITNKAIVSAVVKNSPADKYRLKPNIILKKINNHILKDIIDYQFFADDEALKIEYEENLTTKTVLIKKNQGESLGLVFDSSVFDKLKTCKNNCIFCFINQLPKNLRKPLYLKDDDFRLSFLYGNFITLTNLNKNDIKRIIKQRVSPLYISLHTTNEELRKFMLQTKSKDNSLEHLKQLLENNIEIHIQIVLCPDINDKKELDKTINGLYENYNKIKSIGIVPNGLTNFRESLYPLRLFTKREAKSIIEKINKWQKYFKSKFNSNRIYLADEFYLIAGKEIPPEDEYDDFPQIENGIGIARLFINEALEEISKIKKTIKSKNSFTIITGKLAVPVLDQVIEPLKNKSGINCKVLGIENKLFGKNVTVAGLLGGNDVMNFLKFEKIDGTVLIPDIMLKDLSLFLDDVSIEEIKSNFKFPVRIVPSSGKDFVQSFFS